METLFLGSRSRSFSGHRVAVIVYLSVQPAFTLEAEESGFFFQHSGHERPGGMHVTYGNVALGPQGVVRQAVVTQITVHIMGMPVDNRVHFETSVLDSDYR